MSGNECSSNNLDGIVKDQVLHHSNPQLPIDSGSSDENHEVQNQDTFHESDETSDKISNTEEDPENWHDEGQNIPYQLVVIMFGLVMYIADVGLDVKVAADHLMGEDYFWAIWTLILAFVPCLVMQLVSAWYFKEDEHLTSKVVFFHILFLGPVLRYFDIIWHILQLRKNPQPKVDDYKDLVAKKLDCAMLNLFLAFMEDAPQLVLQIYIKTTLRQYHITFTRVRDLWLVSSLILSLVSLSWSLLNYSKTLRSSVRAKVQLSGLIGIFFWRFFSVSSRVITLALFASIHKLLFFALFGCHFFIMLCFTWKQRISFFEGQPVKQKFLKVLFAYVLFFSYFSTEGKKTRKWSMMFYLITGLENISLIILWYFQQDVFGPIYSTSVLIYVLAAFFLGVFLLSLYYTLLHPSRKCMRNRGCGFKFQIRTLSQRRRRNTNTSCIDQHHIISGVALVAHLSVV